MATITTKDGIALASAYEEMDYIRRITGHLAEAELRKTRRWRMFR